MSARAFALYRGRFEAVSGIDAPNEPVGAPLRPDRAPARPVTLTPDVSYNGTVREWRREQRTRVWPGWRIISGQEFDRRCEFIETYLRADLLP